MQDHTGHETGFLNSKFYLNRYTYTGPFLVASFVFINTFVFLFLLSNMSHMNGQRCSIKDQTDAMLASTLDAVMKAAVKYDEEWLFVMTSDHGVILIIQ